MNSNVSGFLDYDSGTSWALLARLLTVKRGRGFKAGAKREVRAKGSEGGEERGHGVLNGVNHERMPHL